MSNKSTQHKISATNAIQMSKKKEQLLLKLQDTKVKSHLKEKKRGRIQQKYTTFFKLSHPPLIPPHSLNCPTRRNFSTGGTINIFLRAVVNVEKEGKDGTLLHFYYFY